MYIFNSANLATVALYNYDDNTYKQNEGIIIAFDPYDLSVKYFKCPGISSFGAEDERILVNYAGALELHNIVPIKNMKCDLRLFYRHYHIMWII